MAQIIEIALSICTLLLCRTITLVKSFSKVGNYALRNAPNFMKLTHGLMFPLGGATLTCCEVRTLLDCFPHSQLTINGVPAVVSNHKYPYPHHRVTVVALLGDRKDIEVL